MNHVTKQKSSSARIYFSRLLCLTVYLVRKNIFPYSVNLKVVLSVCMSFLILKTAIQL